MNHTDLLHTCLDPKCCQEQGLEAQTEQRGDRVYVRCGRCHRRRDYPTDALRRTSSALVAENLRGSFEVTERYYPSSAYRDPS